MKQNRLLLTLITTTITTILLLALPNKAGAQTIDKDWWSKKPYQIEKLAPSPYTFDEEYMRDEPNIYLPKGKSGKLPAVIVIHGFMGAKEQMDDIAKQIAQHGMIVLSYTALDQGQPFQWLEGLIAAYRVLEGENIRPGSPLRGRIDFQNIGLLGHSMGGAGVLHSSAMTAPNGLRGRIKSVVSMMPYHGTTNALTDNFAGGKDKLGCDIAHMPYPALIISGESDATNEPVGGYEFFNTATARGTAFMAFKGTGHTNWMKPRGIDSRYFPAVMPIITAWFITHLTSDTTYTDYFREDSEVFTKWVKPHLAGKGKKGDKKYFPPYQFKK